MSFIRRADGTTVYGGSHVGSRGSLSSIRNGSNEDYFSQDNEDDLEWERQVIASAVTFQDGVDDYFSQDEYYESNTNIIRRLWGIYDRELCPHLRMEFGEGKNTFRRTE